MSSVSYIDVARKGDLPIIEWGQLDDSVVSTEASGDGARLRVFLSGSYEGGTSPIAPLSSFEESLILVKQMARQDSALREHIHDWVVKSGSGEWTYFQAKRTGSGAVEPLAVQSWSDLTRWIENMSQVFAVEGERSDVLVLLDLIVNQVGGPDRRHRAVAEDASPANAHQAAIDFRNELLAKGWPDGKRVAEMAGTTVRKNPAQYATRLRASGALLGVWDAPERTFRHPDFQFDAHGQLRSEVAELLALLPGANDDRGGWRRAFWLYSPHAQLGNETPAAVFPRDARRVIEVAEGEFRGDRDARW